MNAKRFLFILVVVFTLLSSTACSAETEKTPPPTVVVITVVVEQPSLVATEAPVVKTEAPVVEPPTEAPVAVDPICKDWNPDAKATNWLVPGASARGDVEVNGVKYYDNGVGEGTTIINLSSKKLEVYSEWGSGCEVSTDVKYLVEKDLTVGCGDVGGCKVARVVIFRDGEPEQNLYTEIPE